MTALHIVTLAVVQGLTEFLPISSSGHLVLIPGVTGWPDQGLAFDVAAHFGSLLAVCVYFRDDLRQFLLTAVSRDFYTGAGDEHSRMLRAIVLATIPVSLIGLATHDLIAGHLRSNLVIAATTVGFGLLLLAADWRGNRSRALETFRLRDVIIIGFAQALALIPGTSRSGVTMTAALMLGFTREAAARFSFLLSIPVIALASGYETVVLLGAGEAQPWAQLLVVVVLAALSAYLCIHLFLAWIARVGMAPFAIYRLLLGAALLAFSL